MNASHLLHVALSPVSAYIGATVALPSNDLHRWLVDSKILDRIGRSHTKTPSLLMIIRQQKNLISPEQTSGVTASVMNHRGFFPHDQAQQ